MPADPDPRLVALLAELRPASAFHLESAMRAVDTEGVSGTLVIKIPRRPGAPVDIYFLGGDVRLVIDP